VALKFWESPSCYGSNRGVIHRRILELDQKPFLLVVEVVEIFDLVGMLKAQALGEDILVAVGVEQQPYMGNKALPVEHCCFGKPQHLFLPLSS
jgi:hypothetical protein